MDIEKQSEESYSNALLVNEFDGNGKLDVIYEGVSSGDVSKREAIRPQNRFGSTLDVVRALVDVFLPTGYPHSVGPDYIDYQIYDSIQAFSSSIASLLANRAVLSAVGVGDDNATSTSALFMKITQETVGRMGTILFAWKFGSALEPECKKYRFAADLVNDSAMVFDCLSPMFPGSKSTKIFLLCISGLLRSICGVMAGGSRAALTQHFTDPVRGSIADVNAKDQSQETVITLMGMLTGSFVVGIVQGEGIELWLTLFCLLGVHLWTNYQAVRHVVIRTLNRQRANIVFSDVINSLPELKSTMEKDVNQGQSLSRLILSPKQVSLKERILETDGVLRWYSGNSNSDQIIGYGQFAGFSEFSKHSPKSIDFRRLIKITSKHGYLASYSRLHSTGHVIVYISLLSVTNVQAQQADLKAWVHALLIAKYLLDNPTMPPGMNDPDQAQLFVLEQTEKQLDYIFDDLNIGEALKLANWEFERPAVQSGPNPSIVVKELGSS